MTRRWNWLVTGLFVATLWSGPVYAQTPLGLDIQVFQGLGLNNLQQAQISQILANHRPLVDSLVAQILTAREALEARLYGPGLVTVVDLAPLVQQLGQLRGQLTQERLLVTLEIRGVLTPDQLAAAEQTRQRLNQLRAEMHGLLGDH